MKESYVKGLSNNGDLESCVGNGAGEAADSGTRELGIGVREA